MLPACRQTGAIPIMQNVFAYGFALFYANCKSKQRAISSIQQHAAEYSDRSNSIKNSAVLAVLCAATAQVNIGLKKNIDEPRATEDYMLLPYPSLDASCDLCVL